MAAGVTRKQLAEVIGRRTMQVNGQKELAKHIAAYLVSERQKVDIDSLLRDVMQYRLENGLVEATAVSAHELTPVVIKDIENVLRERFPKAKSIAINTRIDGGLVGGVKIELPRETLDLSIKSKLNLFKRLVAEEGVR